MAQAPVQAILLDIGGVILSKGWGRQARQQAASHFDYDAAEVEERHQLAFPSYEEGRLTLDEYLDWVVFFEPRSFGREAYRAFIFAGSEAHPEMIDLFARVKAKHGVKIVAISNEGKELAEHRARTFSLSSLFDFLVISGFVHHRKPDPIIYHMALDQALVRPEEVLYIDDTPLLVEVGRALGMASVHHTGCEGTRRALEEAGLGFRASGLGSRERPDFGVVT